MVPWVKMSESRDQLLQLQFVSIVYSLIVIIILHYVYVSAAAQ